MKTAAAYVRVSTEDQTEYSPDSQLKAIRAYAQRNNYDLPVKFVFADEGISGRCVERREGFKRMIALAKSKPRPFETILVWKYSRFARNREDSVVYKSMLRRQCGIDVVSVSETIGDDKMSVLFEAMIEAMDEYYSINLAEEVRRGMTEKAKRGGVLSIAPFGYRVENGELAVIEAEAEIIRKVFSGYLSGDGFLTLAKKLNALGVRTHRGNRIENRTVEYWLNNPTYAGKTRWNPTGKTSRDYHNENLIIANGTHEAIIDEKLWNAVQERLCENKARYRKNMHSPKKEMSHWLNGIIRCGICGRALANCSGIYYCSGKGRGSCTGNGGAGVEKAAEAVTDELERIFDSCGYSLRFAIPKAAVCDESESDVRRLQTAIKDENKRLKRVEEAYESGADTVEEYSAKKKKIQKEICGLRELLDGAERQSGKKLETDEDKALRLTDILRSDKVENDVKCSVLRSMIKEIIKTGEDGRTFRIVFRDIQS